MKNLLSFFIVFVPALILAQTASLKVLGKHSYSDIATAYGAILIVEEDPSKCDPDIGFVPLEEQIKHLIEAIQIKGSKSTLIPIKKLAYSEFKQQTFRFEEADQELFDEILTLCNSLTVVVDEIYYKLPDHNLIGEDDKAILALNDAKSKAEKLANHIDYKIVRILNIDDETNNASLIYEYTNGDPEKEVIFNQLIEIFSKAEGDRKKSKKPEIRGAYNLWVTFEIVKK